ncbi:MAG: HIR complex subunit [Icmadophila ericetorum]|nr:HIR complex subunit [Icmadophila ericetorum]
MHYIRPVWLTHGGEKKDFEVYSCHVSPNGERLASAGGDGYVRIWSTDAIYHAGDPNYSKPKQLASMSYHSGTIHTVRFSSSGRFLASGADDKIVCVYTLDPNPPSHAAAFGMFLELRKRGGQTTDFYFILRIGTNEAPPVEHWRIFRRLIGHDNDVQDLGWSYDSSILVTVGLDSKVVVWSGHTFEKLKTISSHQSHVKGLTFDPANKYFATASDDRTIKIFRFTPPGPNSSAHDQMNNFMLEKTITAPFTASPLTTYFRRCSWSPDGMHIGAANAVNGPVSSVAILNRGTWDGDIHLIGHEGPVEVCAFSPRLFSKIAPENTPLMLNGQPIHQSLVTAIACAGQDKALSVWITSNPRPLVITQDLTVKSISDLAWSPDGRSLFVTSLDGSIIAVVFGENELGYGVSFEENERALAKYGGGRRGVGIVEGPAALLLEERAKQGEIRGVEGRMGALMGDGVPSAAPVMNGDGSATRPTALQSNDLGPAIDSRNGPTSTASIIVDGPESTIKPQEASAKTQDALDPHAAKLERLKQRVTITKDGKKRIAPLLVSSSGAAESSLPRSQLMASTSHQSASDTPQAILDLSKPFDGLPKGGLAGLLLGNKRKYVPEESDNQGHIDKKITNASRNGAVPILSNAANGLVTSSAQPAVTGQEPTPEFVRPAVLNPSLIVSQLRLAVPKVRLHVVRTVGGTSNTSLKNGVNGNINIEAGGLANAAMQANTVFEARNPATVSARFEDREPARIAVTKRGQPVWQDYLPRSVLLITGDRNFWAAACEDGSIYAWTPAGRRIVNALVLESQPVILECKDWWLLCITAVGMCYVWDMNTLSSQHPPVSLAPVLDIATQNLQAHPTKVPAVTSARLNSEGRIVVTLNNGDGYAYSKSMYVWQRLSEVWWAVGSQYWNTQDSSVGNLTTNGDALSATNVSAGVIPYLEKSTTNETLVRGRAYLLQRLIKQLLPREGFEGFESNVSIAHLENRVAAAMMLGAKAEFQTYLYMYAKRLGAEGLKMKVEELLRGILGETYDNALEVVDADAPVDRAAVDRCWSNPNASLCGWPRRELLQGVILILGKHRDLQRITVPYARVTGVVNNQSGTDDAMIS